jgi:hypothetical protein
MAQGGVIVADEDRMGRPKPWHTFENIHDGFLAERRISTRAWHGANKFLAIYHLANGSGCKAGGFGEPVSKSTGEMSNKQANAKKEIRDWSRAMAPDLFDLMEAVFVLGQKSPSTWARDRDMHPTAGAYLLAAAMEQFAAQFGGGE